MPLHVNGYEIIADAIVCERIRDHRCKWETAGRLVPTNNYLILGTINLIGIPIVNWNTTTNTGTYVLQVY